jgi:hypothetical protein
MYTRYEADIQIITLSPLERQYNSAQKHVLSY